MKILLNIGFTLLMTTFSSAYAGDCINDLDVPDCRVKAEQGLADAQYNLGLMYAKGRDVIQDDKEAVKWFREAAEQGNSAAQYNLGVMYAKGRGVLQDDKEAVKWFREAAEQGDVKAQYALGRMYENGEGVLQDDKEAFKWYGKAAEQGHADAQIVLGVMYVKGQGVLQDYVMAHMYWHIAAVSGDKNAIKNRGRVAKMMTSSQIAEAQKLAREWHGKTAEQDYKKANYCSSLFMIMTSVQITKKDLGQYFTQQGTLSGILTGLYLGEETGKSVTNGMISKLKSKEMKNIGNTYPKNISQIEGDISSCIGWTYAVNKVIQSKRSFMKNDKKYKQVLLSAPRPNKKYKYPYKDYHSIKPYIKVAFDNWVTMGKTSHDSFKYSLQESLK